MDKFAVIKIYKYSSPSVMETFDNLEDAKAYCAIYKHKEPEYEYGIFQLVEVV